MKNKLRRALAVALCFVVCVSLSVNALAAGKERSPYEEILNGANKLYNLDLGYIPVNDKKVSLDDYKNEVYRFAAEQRALLDYIEDVKNEQLLLSLPGSTRASVVKTKTKPTWNLGERFTITATYTVYDGIRISLCRNARINYTSVANYTNTYLTNVSGPTYSVMDNGRTSTVRYTATVHFNNLYGFSNTVLYTEFYYSE